MKQNNILTLMMVVEVRRLEVRERSQGGGRGGLVLSLFTFYLPDWWLVRCRPLAEGGLK